MYVSFYIFIIRHLFVVPVIPCFIEWRAGMAGHLILSDQDLTSVVQGSWKRLNTLQHYKVSQVVPQHNDLILWREFFFCFVFFDL